MGNKLLAWPASRKHDSRHISTFSAVGSTATGDHCTFPLMPLNPLAPAFLPPYRFPSHLPISLCNSTKTSLPLAQTFPKRLHRSPHLMVFPSPIASLTVRSSSLLLCRRTHLIKVQKLFNYILDLQLFCPNLSNIRRNAYK